MSSSTRINDFIATKSWEEVITNLPTATPDELKYKDANGWDLLYFACYQNAPTDVVQALINAGFNVNGINNDWRTPVHSASYKGKSIELLQVVLENGGNPNLKDFEGQTALYWACESGLSIDKIMLLLQFGGDPDIAADNGMKPVDVAEKNQHSEIVTLLSANWPPTKSAVHR
jgi:ankyrin repeat protein